MSRVATRVFCRGRFLECADAVFNTRRAYDQSQRERRRRLSCLLQDTRSVGRTPACAPTTTAFDELFAGP